MAKVEVRAIENGHDGNRYIHVGERFSVERSRLKDGSTWFKEVTRDDANDGGNDGEDANGHDGEEQQGTE
jgi:hypothetical protein